MIVMMSEIKKYREMSRRLAELAMTVPLSAELIADIHTLYNELELFAEELESKKTSLVVARRKGNTYE